MARTHLLQIKRENRTYSLLLAVLGSLDVEDDLAILLLSRHDFGVELELETLLGEDLLEGLAVKRIRRKPGPGSVSGL